MMAIIKLNTKNGLILVNPDHIIYVQSLTVASQDDNTAANSRINFSIPTKHEKRDVLLIDVIETVTAIALLIAKAK